MLVTGVSYSHFWYVAEIQHNSLVSLEVLADEGEARDTFASYVEAESGWRPYQDEIDEVIDGTGCTIVGTGEHETCFCIGSTENPL